MSPRDFGQSLVRPHLRMGSGLVDLNGAISRGLLFIAENGYSVVELRELLGGITDTIDEYTSEKEKIVRSGRRLI